MAAGSAPSQPKGCKGEKETNGRGESSMRACTERVGPGDRFRFGDGSERSAEQEAEKTKGKRE